MSSVSEVSSYENNEPILSDFFNKPTGKVGYALLKKFISDEERNYPRAFEISKKLIVLLTHKVLPGRTQGAVVTTFSELLREESKEQLSKPFYGWIRFALAWNNAKKGLSTIEKTLAAYEDAATLGCNIARHYKAECLQEAGRDEDALKEWQECVKQFPEDEFARDMLAKLQAQPKTANTKSAEIALFDDVIKGLHTVQEQMQAKDAQIVTLEARVASLTEELEAAKAGAVRIPMLEKEVALYQGKFTEAVKMFKALFPQIEPSVTAKKPEV